MNKKYEIPIDNTSCCYSSRTEKLKKVKDIPEELKPHTNLDIKEYKKIINTCNNYFRKRKLSNIIFIIFPICVVVGVVLFTKSIVNPKFTSIFIIAPLIIAFILYIIINSKINDNFNNRIIKLNNKYQSKGIKIEYINNKNRKNIIRVFIVYNQSFNLSNQELEAYPQIYNEVELSPINNIYPNGMQTYYIASIAPPPTYNNSVVSLEKNNDNSNINYNNTNSNYNTNNNININNINNTNNSNNTTNTNNTINNIQNQYNIPIDDQNK